MERLLFNQVTIIGLGFLGASFALAIRKMGMCKTIYGFSRNPENLEKAKVRGIIDNYSFDLCQIIEGSDLVMLATPVGVFMDIIDRIKGILKKGSVITDVGSIKGSLVYEIESVLSEDVYYIGSHPIAGGEKSGIENAKSDLFNNALCIITPTEKSNSGALESLKNIWQSIGSRVEFMEPYWHDEVYAIVSHLPHITAYALVNTLGDVDEDAIRFAGQGFKDTTRIAMSSPEIWRDISAHNKENLIKLIHILKDNLTKIEGLLDKDDLISLEKEFRRSKILRERIK